MTMAYFNANKYNESFTNIITAILCVLNKTEIVQTVDRR